jgi:hypothetical protein
VSNRENKATAGEFRQLVGVDFEEFTCRTSAKLLLALSKFAEPINMAVLQFADEKYPLFQQQRERLLRAIHHAWQRRGPDIGTAATDYGSGEAISGFSATGIRRRSGSGRTDTH